MLAIVPFKGPEGAKARLAAALSQKERARLALDMLGRVLGACEAAASIERTLLVTPDLGVAPAGLDVLLDEGRGHSEAIELALGEVSSGAGVFVVMADCPLADAQALDALAGAARPLALVPARDGGVNALALQDSALFRPRFGIPAEEMVAAARRAGLEPVVVDDGRLSLDVDRPEDLAFA